MTSELELTSVIKSLQWCTDLPSLNSPRKRKVSLSNKNECVLLFVLEEQYGTLYFSLYIEFKCKRTEFKSCHGELQVEIKREEFGLSLDTKTLELSKPDKKEIWYISRDDLQQKLLSYYMGGTSMKFLFCFEIIPEPILKICEKVDDRSVQTPLYIDSSFLLEGVSKDLSSLFDESTNHDVEFTCGDQAIKAHKNILCCRSEVFATMLRTEMAEGKTGQIKIEDIDCTVFKQFLRYLYTGVLPELTVDTALQIYEVADKYAVSALKKQCASFLVEHLSPGNACEILIISDRHSDSDFKKSVIEYVLEEEIPFEGEILAKFCKDNSTLAAEMLHLFCLHRREKKILS